MASPETRGSWVGRAESVGACENLRIRVGCRTELLSRALSGMGVSGVEDRATFLVEDPATRLMEGRTASLACAGWKWEIRRMSPITPVGRGSHASCALGLALAVIQLLRYVYIRDKFDIWNNSSHRGAFAVELKKSVPRHVGRPS